jgi:uncharacterized protein YecE (DUF72 family)
VELFVGTSGYSYKEWKGHFYPEDLPDSEMLAFYGRQFRSVEINNTFYRMPKRETVEKWRDVVPPGFSFVLKAPQRITHQRRLKGAEADLEYFFSVRGALGDSPGPVLFQLPPFLKKDLVRLKEFLSALPKGVRAAFEFRHDSWFEPDVLAALAEGGAALCHADTEDTTPETFHATSDWGYLRLRRPEYDEATLSSWAARIRSQPWSAAWVFFKHEDEGKGPALAKRFLQAAAQA